MGIYIANQVIKLMIKKGHKIEGSAVIVLGITFKENCSDIRNSKVIDVIRELQEFGCVVDVYDPRALPEEVKHEYQIDMLCNLPDLSKYNSIILAVAHDDFQKLHFVKNNSQVIFDVKSFLVSSDATL